MSLKVQNQELSPRVLMLAPYRITPADTGGKIRVFELARGVSENNIQVTVLMPMSPAKYTRTDINKRMAIEVFPYPFVLPFLFTGKPFSYSYLISLHPGLRYLMKRFFESFDIIQFEGVSFAGLLDHISRSKKIVYDAHNVEYDYARSETNRPWVRNISVQRIRRLEQKITQRADRILTCSSNDAERLTELYDIRPDKCTVIPNGIHLRKGSPALSNEDVGRKFPRLMDFPQRAIFSGSDVAHNRAAVRFLIESVAPRLEKECAFVIKGQCGNHFREHARENVFFDGEFGNVGPYAEACTVALNPVMQGSGTSLKVLDYLAHGLPVVSTEFGMRGFDDLKRLVTLAEPDEFAAALQRKTLFSAEILSNIEKYSWGSIAAHLSEIYRPHEKTEVLEEHH